MSFMPRTMHGVRQLRLALGMVIACGTMPVYLMVETKQGLVMALIPYSVAAQWLLRRFDRHFVDGFRRRK